MSKPETSEASKRDPVLAAEESLHKAIDNLHVACAEQGWNFRLQNARVRAEKALYDLAVYRRDRDKKAPLTPL